MDDNRECHGEIEFIINDRDTFEQTSRRIEEFQKWARATVERALAGFTPSVGDVYVTGPPHPGFDSKAADRYVILEGRPWRIVAEMGSQVKVEYDGEERWIGREEMF